MFPCSFSKKAPNTFSQILFILFRLAAHVPRRGRVDERILRITKVSASALPQIHFETHLLLVAPVPFAEE